jgi:hypothetical protein
MESFIAYPKHKPAGLVGRRAYHMRCVDDQNSAGR